VSSSQIAVGRPAVVAAAGSERAARTRDITADILRGIGITGIVAIHLPLSAYQGKWFAVLLFFVVSGYLYRPAADWRGLGAWALRRTRSLLVPYTVFLAVTVAGWALVHALRPGTGDLSSQVSPRFATWASLLLGGRALTGCLAIYWFITCLLVTQLAFAVLHLGVRNPLARGAVLAGAYLLAHVESWRLSGPSMMVVPWSADSALFTLPFYAAGFYGKAFIQRQTAGTRSVEVAAMLACAGLLAAESLGLMHYRLDVRGMHYHALLLDLLIPGAFLLAVVGASHALVPLGVGRGLAAVGSASLAIMYLHLPLGKIVQGALAALPGVPVPVSILVLAAVELGVPLVLVRVVCSRSALLRFLLLGAPYRREEGAGSRKQGGREGAVEI